MILSFLFAASLLGQSEVALVRFDATKSSQPGLVNQFKLSTTPPALVGSLAKGYSKFFAFGGKRPIRQVIALDLEGNGSDEYVVMREKLANHEVSIELFAQPKTNHLKQPKPIASFAKGALPQAGSDGAISSLGRIDFDGDANDELLLVRDYADGHQEIEILEPPQSKKAPLGPLIARVTDAGLAGQGRIVAAFGFKLGALTALGRVMRLANGETHVVAHPLPVTGTSTLAPSLFESTLALGAGEEVLACVPFDTDGGGLQQILVTTASGGSTLRLDSLPLLGPTGFGAFTTTYTHTSATPRLAVGLPIRRPPPPPTDGPVMVVKFVAGEHGSTTTYQPLKQYFVGMGTAQFKANGSYEIVTPGGQTLIFASPIPGATALSSDPPTFQWTCVHPTLNIPALLTVNLTSLVVAATGSKASPSFLVDSWPSLSGYGTLNPMNGGLPPSLHYLYIGP